MVICSDTSFLFSIYGPADCHTPGALAWLQGRSEPLLLSLLNIYELENSLRFSESRGFIQPGHSDQLMRNFRKDLLEERLVKHDWNLKEILEEATRLSAAHTLTGGHRSFDILHVAAAKIMAASHFLTFDNNQKALAEKVGLIVPL